VSIRTEPRKTPVREETGLTALGPKTLEIIAVRGILTQYVRRVLTHGGRVVIMGKAVSTVMYCSFCGRESRQVQKLISGHGVYICGECVTKCVAILEGRPDRDTVPLRDREDYSDDELLDEIPRVAATTANVEADLRARVDELRQRGVAWSRIAAALGVTRQSAWERFTHD
jgi:hypothetical protein